MKTARLTTSAHTGFVEWLLQRVSALYLAGFCLVLAVRLVVSPFPHHYSWASWFMQAEVRLAWGLALASLLVHAWIGMRSVYLDYLKPMWLRFSVQLVTAFALAGMALWSVEILWGGGW